MIRRRAAFLLLWSFASLWGETRVEHPFAGVTHITRTEESPRKVTMHVVRIDLSTPGLSFRLTPPGGSRETVRETTLEFLRRQKAQIAINAHFFTPYPSKDADAFLVGLAASDGVVYSAFERPEQSYALLANAPAINIDDRNRARVVHRDPAFEDGLHVMEKDVKLWNSVSGSAQIVTGGEVTIPQYEDGALTTGGPLQYSNAKSWYEVPQARTVIALADDNKALYLFTVDRAGGSLGMTLREIANLLIADYGVTDAINLDGGGSTTLAMEDRIVNTSSDKNPNGRAVASSLAVFVRSATAQ